MEGPVMAPTRYHPGEGTKTFLVSYVEDKLPLCLIKREHFQQISLIFEKCIIFFKKAITGAVAMTGQATLHLPKVRTLQ